jgi:hypothetical protein
MDLDLGQLRALRAAVDGGTLEAAARELHITPSAVSQRLKALSSRPASCCSSAPGRSGSPRRVARCSGWPASSTC